VDASRVHGGLWVGSAPYERDPELEGFDLLVFAAIEYQPTDLPFYLGKVLHCGIEDESRDLLPGEIDAVMNAARTVSHCLWLGEDVLVTCISGWNRSCLVAGMALVLGGMQWSEAFAMLRQARGRNALCNEYHRGFLEASRA